MSKESWKKSITELVGFEGEVDTVLDVACGLSLRSKYIDAKVRVGVDIYPEYFKHIESDVPYAVVKGDVRKLNELFVSNSFDLVIALDIVEHLFKDEAIKMLEECEKIAKIAVIIETPLGYIPQNMDILGHGGHEYQTHRSGWTEEELQALGYKTFVRDYAMQDVPRHTFIDVEPNIQLIEAIKYV